MKRRLVFATVMVVGVLLIGYLIVTGIGIWGNNSPVFWAFDITNFVFWIGIGHAGTLISAILFLFRQKWRTAINRSAEAMTIFAVICALIFPGIHMGRIWFAYWLAPYPNQMSLWPNFRSPLLWDVFAVTTYFIVSALFWYLGMIPDLATLRNRATNKFRYFTYGALALGWRGSARQWYVYERAYLFLAALATPLVVLGDLALRPCYLKHRRPLDTRGARPWARCPIRNRSSQAVPVLIGGRALFLLIGTRRCRKR